MFVYDYRRLCLLFSRCGDSRLIVTLLQDFDVYVFYLLDTWLYSIPTARYILIEPCLALNDVAMMIPPANSPFNYSLVPFLLVYKAVGYGLLTILNKSSDALLADPRSCYWLRACRISKA